MFFLWLHWVLWVCEEEHSGSVIFIISYHGYVLWTWLITVVFVSSVSTLKLLFFPPPTPSPFHTFLLEGSQYVQPTLKQWGVIPHPFVSAVCTKLFGILLHKRFVSSPFIYFFNYLFMSVWTHAYLFYTLGYNPIPLYFVTQTVLVLAI